MRGRISSPKKRKLSPGYGKELKEREGLKTQRIKHLKAAPDPSLANKASPA